VQQARAIELEHLWPLTDVVVEQMAPWYPELAAGRMEIQQVVRAEEERFSETLERGLKVFEELAGGETISGEEAFRLAATYGFPVELTVELAEERGQAVDVDGYRDEMARHRDVSRAGSESGVQRAAEFGAGTDFATEFVGFDKTDVLTQIGALEELGDGTFLAKLRESPFYVAGGGQVTDAGELIHEETGVTATLHEAHRLGDDQVLVFAGDGFAAGDRVRAVVPWAVRFPTMANHTATHLLHEALRQVLGEHVKQAGSAVRPEKLRFDFSHEQALTPEQRSEVEQIVNEQVFRNRAVRIFETPIEEAKQLGAQMLFGEKYGDVVRVVEIDGFSRELCGGTHVRSTAEIGPFAIVSEGSVGSGARRIEAVTSGEAFALLQGRAREADELRAELERVRKEAKRAPAAATSEDFVVTRETQAGDVNVLVVEVRSGDPLDVSDRLKQKHAPAAVIVGALTDGTAQLVINLDKSLEARGVHAGNVVREAAPLIGGGGGGRPTMARAGGKRPEGLEEALSTAERLITAALS
jgi:alanyl-tRNA synthetase